MVDGEVDEGDHGDDDGDEAFFLAFLQLQMVLVGMNSLHVAWSEALHAFWIPFYVCVYKTKVIIFLDFYKQMWLYSKIFDSK